MDKLPTPKQLSNAAAILGSIGGRGCSEKKRLALIENAKHPRPNRRKKVAA
jgi:hypothetical protein